MPRAGGLAELAASLGTEVLSPLLIQDGAEVGPVAVLDPQDHLPLRAGALVLAVGVAPSDAPGVVAELAGQGAGAVVVKLRGADPGPVTEAAGSAQISVLAAGDSLPWQQLLDLLGTASTGDDRAVAGVALGDLFGLANAIAAATGGATAVEDPTRKILAYSTIPGQQIDGARQEGILGRQVPLVPDADDSYRRLYRAQGAIRVNSDEWQLGRLAVAVRSGAELLGSIWVIDDGSLSTDAEDALIYAGRLAALHLLRSRSGADLERQARGESLRALLEGRGSPALVAERIGVPAGGCQLIAVAAPGAGAGDELLLERLHELVALRCAAAAAASTTTVVGEVVWALLAGHDRGETASLVEGIVSRSGAALGVAVRVAVGEPGDQIADLPATRRELDHILAVITRKTSTRSVASRGDVHAALVLLELTQSLAANPRLQLASVSAMVEHDRAQGGRYVETVLAYLDCLTDVPTAAEVVAVHPNTFRYRLRRAAELFGVNLDDPDERLVLWLQLRALAAGP